MKNAVVTIAALAVAGALSLAPTASAATVNVSGYANLATIGDYSALTPGSNGVFNTTTQSFSVNATNFTMSGDIRARSTVRDVAGGREQAMSLSWQNLRIETCTLTEISFSVTVRQNFVISPEFTSQQASFNSFASYTHVDFAGSGQRASVTRTRSDGGKVSDVTIARTRTATGHQSVLLDGESGFGSSLASVGSIYQMTMTFQFVLRPNGCLLSLCDVNGPTDTTLVMVPLPTSAWAGLGGLALVGGVSIKRRRAMQGE